MDTTIEARLFGTFRLQCSADDIRPRSRKSCGLLAYLIASDRRSASRTRIAELLWGDRGDEQARSSLRQAVREVRTGAAGSAVTATRTDLGILPGHIVSDIEQIELLVGRRDVSGLAVLLAGIEGGFLDDLDGLSPAFDEWLQGERSRQRDWLFTAALICAAAHSNSGSPAERQLLAELARLDPLDEAVARRRLHIDHASGDVAALHRTYRRLTTDLSRELNVSPSRSTRELFDTLTAAVPAGDDLAAAIAPPFEPPIVRPAAPGLARIPPVVAVMPFEGDGDGSARIAAGLSDAVCTSLSQSAEFRVMPIAADSERLAALSQRAVAVFTLRIGVRDNGGMTTMTAHLSRVETGFLVWSEQLRTVSPDEAWIDTLVERIVGAVSAGVERDVMSEQPKLQLGRVDDEVASLYSRGKRIAREARTLMTLRQGIAMLERVAENDPRHVGARLRLAQLNNTDYHYLLAGHDVQAMRARALVLTREAADLEPSSVRVQLRLAWCLLRESEWDRAAGLFHAAAATMGHDPDAANECGFGLAQLGELDAARALIQRAFRLNPFAPAEYHADFAVLLALAGDHATAEAHFEVCGEQRLFWQVIRLSNLTRLGMTKSHLTALQQRFVSTFHEIWVRPRPPGLADVLDWAGMTFCFRDAAHRDLIAAGVTAAWASCAPAATGNNG